MHLGLFRSGPIWSYRGHNAVLALADLHQSQNNKAEPMHNGEVFPTLRRSSRVPTAIQILVTSLDQTHFSEVCETTVVNAHGFAIRTRVKLDAGAPLHLHSKDGRQATAQVVSCQPIGQHQQGWRLGARLDQPQNFWGLRDCPKDWTLPAAPTTPKHAQILKSSNTIPAQPAPARVSPAAPAASRNAGFSEAQILRMIADSVQPLQAELRSLKETLAQRGPNPSRFEVSLASIPPELEQQIEARLRKNLTPRVVDEARQQSAELLSSAKAALDQRTNQSYDSFLRGVAQELKAVEKRAQEFSAHLSEETQQHLHRGLEELRQKLLDGGNALKRLGEELCQFLQDNLNAEHDARCAELEQLRTAVVSESSRLQEQVEHLDARIATLAESASNLESGLDQRLSRISSDTVKDTRAQFERVAHEILEEMTARSDKALTHQLGEASGKLTQAQNETVCSVSGQLKIRAADALQVFERSMDELARISLERFRLKLEGSLHALAKSLNEQFPVQAQPGGDAEN